jgi:NAD(P)H-dependent FMN reductase
MPFGRINLLQKINKHEKNYRFGASSSKDSINKQLATYAGQFENASVEVLDLNDYEMPIFSTDKEAASGIPTLATDFYAKLEAQTYL